VVVVGDVPGGLAGGPRRRDSVAAGLAALPAEASAVLVHDAARPLATVELAKRVIDRLAVGDVDGVVPAVGVTDAVKSIDASGHVVAVDRASLFVAQTPQGFKPASLLAAHAADDADAADDAELIERWGGTVAFVEGEPSNVKITYPSDLEIAAAMLEGR
jgi:2-C-methyl-D-erythritol 4-phosphate cytidylyltransferase